MFSKACEYAIRAMIYVFRQTRDGSKTGIKDIARYTGTPEPFVAKILQVLSRGGIVSSSKGPNGGFFIPAKTKKIHLIEIVKAIDGNNLFVSCGLGIKNCSARKPCPIHHQYATIRDAMTQMLMTCSIEDLANRLDNGETFLVKG